MKKLTYEESSNIYGGMAFTAFVAMMLDVTTSIISIIKMVNASSGSVKKTSTGSELNWEANKIENNTKSPAFFGY